VPVAERMYARALFEAAQDQGKLADVGEQVSDFVDAVREVPELRALLVNPELDTRLKADALGDLLGGADELVRNFLLLLAEKGRIGQLEEIGREFDALVAAEEGRLDVELTTAVELSDEDADRLVGQIEQASGRTVVATRRVDPNLIGGLILQAGSQRVDASVRGRLDRLRHQLRTRR
jgi:F-type H+-transporting ATPase subunit delta